MKSFIANQLGTGPKLLALRGLLADRRGGAALETVIITPVLLFALSFPIADMGVAAFSYMQVEQAMRDLGALVQYKQPPDLTNVGNWTLPTTSVGTFSVAIGAVFPTSEKLINITVSCGTPVKGAVAGPACTSADLTDTSKPKYVWMGAVIKLNPKVIKSLTGGNIGYTERLQWPLAG
jgi:Flp pilus assembly protein TadG